MPSADKGTLSLRDERYRRRAEYQEETETEADQSDRRKERKREYLSMMHRLYCFISEPLTCAREGARAPFFPARTQVGHNAAHKLRPAAGRLSARDSMTAYYRTLIAPAVFTSARDDQVIVP